ncbi:MAG: helix-turn-helix transcriptional regulator [Oribacterium sp.]|nr:helix-turn-helix transcriptional regulator [Oribacterium sp.]
MALGERINFFRRKNNMTMNYLGRLLGFTPKSADVRIAQYEKDQKTPKDDLIDQIAAIFKISPRALKVPDIDTYDGLMHTLFALEDIYGISAGRIDGEICLRLNKQVTQPGTTLWNAISAWADQKEKLQNGEITLSQYDEWRYNYPRDDHSQIRAHVIPQELSDAILEGLKNGELTVQEKSIKRKTRKNFKRKGMPEHNNEE